MNLVLSVHFENSFFEYALPNVNNSAISAAIPAGVSGFLTDVTLDLEVWNGQWRLRESETAGFYRDPQRRAFVELRDGLRVPMEEKRSGSRFSVVTAARPPGSTGFDKYRLVPGRLTIGREHGSNIYCGSQKLMSAHHAVLDVAQDLSCSVTDMSNNGTFVGGRRISGVRPLAYGETIDIFGLKIVYLGDIIAVNRPSDDCRITGIEPFAPPLRPDVPERESGEDSEYYQRSPRLVETPDDEEIEIEAPPAVNRSRRQPLLFTIGPSMTMVIPMASGALFTMFAARQSGQSAGAFMFMGIITSVTAAFIGIFWALMNLRYQKKTEAEDARLRDEAYRKYLDRIHGILEEKHAMNRALLGKLYPPASAAPQFARERSLRVWDRNVNHRDFLHVRLGLGNIPSPNLVKAPKEKFTLVDDELAQEPHRIADEYTQLKNVPITLPLRENNLIGVISANAHDTENIARVIAVQIAAYHSYNDVRMVFLYKEAEQEKYEFARLLPHVWSEDGQLRMLACDDAGTGEVLYHLSTLLRARTEDADDAAGSASPAPHYVIFVSDPSIIEGEAASKYLYAPTSRMGISVVLPFGTIGRLPNSCNILVRCDDEFCGFFSMDGTCDSRGGVRFDAISARDAAQFARSLSDMRIREEQAAGAVPSSLSFLDMYKVSRAEDLDVYRNWLQNRSYESMKAMIGYRGAETPLYLDIHEKYHGPHGLVAGTTGSGKSETLQTYILSLAVSFDPREVSFILIDYKGGGMAKSFEGMPHVAGIITNLGGNQTNRALASINSEIKRRQSVFNDYGVKHIDEYIELYRAERADAPMPHLLIISDEFAELKKEQPEFVRELVSAARVGRSLGIHLILATQDPSASVDEEIWSNSRFKLCLRVAGKQNSQAVLRRPDAAHITNAGRGYFQVGNDEIFELFQSGWSGAAYEPETPYGERTRDDVKMINLWGKAAVKPAKKKTDSGGEKVTQLRAVSEHISSVAAEHGITAIADIWLPPLPELVSPEDFDQPAPVNGSLAVTLGLADYPAGQRQFGYTLDLIPQGHLMIAGPGGSGKTTLLQTLLYGLAARYTPEQVNFYIADFNSRTLGVFTSLPHCGGVIFDDDADKTDKLMTMLTRELGRRVARFSEKGIGTYREYSKLYGDVPAIIFAVDNFAAFTENKDKLQDALTQLTRQSASYGIFLVLTCQSAGDVRGRIRQNMGCGIGLQMTDRFEYEEVIGQKPEFLADDRVTGRGLAVCAVGDKPEALEVQFALAFDEPDGATRNAGLRAQFERIAATPGVRAAPRIPQIPDDLSVDNLLCIPEIAEKCGSGRYIPLGYDITEAAPLYIDLTDTFCYTISGGPRSGKTTLLKALMTLCGRNGFTLRVYDGAARELESFARELGAGYIADSGGLYDFFENELVPEIKRRNPAKGDFIDGGRIDPDAHFASEPKICLFVNDYSAFCDAVYNSERDMKGYIETILLPKGKLHMFYIFACISPDDFAGEWGTKPLLRKFTAHREGLHLGGNIDNQRVFDFEIPMLRRGQKLPAGQGHVVDGGVTKRVNVIT
ncbi:MAG: type VII secretion protein EssC [Oscillospiraceae bacterium]|nr:type VII secretion protein EssC [Oscillospiraceae bacterium]